MFFTISCDINFYGDKDLGGDFYYMVEPAFNSIYIAKLRDNPYQNLGPYIIRNVNSIGFNKNIILVSNKINDSVKYYLIDKNKELKRGYADRLKKTNFIILDSLLFFKFQKKHKINIKTNEEYWKEYGWE